MGEKEGVDKSGGEGWSKEVEKKTDIKKQQGRQAGRVENCAFMEEW